MLELKGPGRISLYPQTVPMPMWYIVVVGLSLYDGKVRTEGSAGLAGVQYGRSNQDNLFACLALYLTL